jgi:hypothetical protein
MNYYKMKKTMGNDKKKEFKEIIHKQFGDFNNFEKMEMGHLIHNLNTNLNDLKSCIN